MAGKYQAGQKIRANYYASVYKPSMGAWRSEWVEAELEVISPGKAKVVSATMEQAGSNRQRFNVGANESKQIGSVKIISKLSNVEIIN